MSITVFNTKGGVGKTRIAVNLALMLDWPLITNDINTHTVEKIFRPKHFIKLEREKEIPTLPKDVDVVFDLGGFTDKRAKNAIDQSDWVLIPALPEEDELQATINTIAAVEKITRNIIVIANRTKDKEDLAYVEAAINGHFKSANEKPRYRVLELKKSRAMPNITQEGKSIRDMVKEGGLKRYSYRKIAQQFEDLVKLVTK